MQARLFTKLQMYPIQETPLSLPATAGQQELNAVTKGLISADINVENDSVEFDFLISNVFLTSKIKDFINTNSLSTESVLEIEVVLKEESPKKVNSLLHDDWVSSIDYSGSLIISGSYDNLVNVWHENQGKHLAALEGHTKPVKSVVWIPYQNGDMFLSGSQDQTILIWEYNYDDKEKDLKSVDSKCICRGHSGSVDCIAVHKHLTKFASGSWDKMIKLWDFDLSVDDEIADESKKRKSNDKDDGIIIKTPLVTFSGHKEPVSCLQWCTENQLISGSWDHCLKIWDIESSINKETISGNKVFLDISYSSLKNLIATGSTDNIIRIFDLQNSSSSVIKSTLKSHKGWVSCIQWSPYNENHLISGSYDKKLYMWDVRNSESPLLEIVEQDDKIMCLCWKAETILSGGADNKVHIFRGQK